jgi:hypothetical protein
MIPQHLESSGLTGQTAVIHQFVAGIFLHSQLSHRLVAIGKVSMIYHDTEVCGVINAQQKWANDDKMAVCGVIKGKQK